MPPWLSAHGVRFSLSVVGGSAASHPRVH